ncbi:MAG: VOC family protein [Desulfuromonadaceae bacterium]|nr:VOC family protein [Desulfuromonadaceae bacterium]MDD5107030.1 VOC family protein [Desulfuromonadaceae bacterium]
MAAPMYAHMGLNCRDMAVTESFYCTHFGFRRARMIPLGDDQIVFLKSGEVYLELFKATGDTPELPYTNDGPSYAGFRHISFTVDDVDAAVKAIGAEVTLGPLSFDDFIPGWKSVWLKDPDGRIIEISQGYKDEG